MRITTNFISRAPTSLGLAPRLQPLLQHRQYATQLGLGGASKAGSKRKKVTPFNDTGAVPWSQFKTAHYNRAVDRIRSDQRCIELLGDPKKISAHGEETYNKWRRARPIASTVNTDSRGHDHLLMHFHVEGPLNKGVVYLHMVKTPSSGEFEYKYLYVDIRGQQRIYLENADTAGSGSGKKGFKFLGISW
ncbi:Mitochondrial import inner membrane translocase subunit TIM21 [Colletotrichum orbiculare MAFF 240422]|uniref:Mitochondrial import inner membrane translocase subunit Tim21 n=1 Tax=Colletotrichum orbiculare (strain 104-T / ATCC 96160 / CBS 514.97 / LARS 414 / MAFF 240422) TaxID=1213857 RepID=A0A484FZV7_COLOR|nr:Mitochondrial import inner membrane translocase subunit TIM21 [Colletotrichum orbiculare MAFF 240422]